MKVHQKAQAAPSEPALRNHQVTFCRQADKKLSYWSFADTGKRLQALKCLTAPWTNRCTGPGIARRSVTDCSRCDGLLVVKVA
jgi:hypothetical protein